MKYKYLLAIFLILVSCKSRLSCEHEKELFQERWTEKVKEVYRSDQYKNTFVIETFSGKRISFQPPQDVVYLSSYGDSLIKKANSFEVEIRTTDRDTFFSRVSSVTCDTVVMRELGFEYNKWADIVKIKRKKN